MYYVPDMRPSEAVPTLRGPEPTSPLAPMDHDEKMRMRAAAFRAKVVYPGPVAELISRELLSWEDFGYRLGGNKLVMRLVDDVLKTAGEPDTPGYQTQKRVVG